MNYGFSKDKADKLAKSSSLIAVLVQIEDFLDSLDLYAHANWLDGVIIDGPNLSRYWVSVKLKYDANKMPDPNGGMRLVKRGVKVTYQKASEEKADPVVDQDSLEPGTNIPKMAKHPIWIIGLNIPRRFINDPLRADIDSGDE